MGRGEEGGGFRWFFPWAGRLGWLEVGGGGRGGFFLGWKGRRAGPLLLRALLTVRLTLPLCLRWLPAFGLCEITRPARTLLEKACLIFPAEQACALSARFAAERLLPFTFGTTQFLSVNFAVAVRSPLMLSLHLDLLCTRRARPAGEARSPCEAFAFSVTDVPYAYLCEHVFGHLMPAGELVIFPEPFPDF